VKARSRRGLGRLAVLVVLLLALGAAVAGAETDDPPPAPDGITPATVQLSLGKGSSATVSPTLHLNAAPPKADILLAIDTTGSMSQAIADARSDANAIVGDIQQTIPGARFAIVDFKDYPTPPFGGEGDYPWRVDLDFTTNQPTSPCSDGPESQVSEVTCALNQLSASGGNDNPEAYNRAFYEAASDSALHWGTGASRFMIVLGDSLPHDSTMNTDFPGCPNTEVTDPGSAFGNHPDVGPLHTQPTLALLKQTHTNLSFVTYNPGGINWGGDFTTFGCQTELAQYTGGSAVVHGPDTATLENQIVSLVNQAAAHVDSIALQTTAVSSPDGSDFSPAAWVSFDPPPPYGPLTAPADLTYQMTVNVPEETPNGDYTFEVHAIADNSDRATQTVTVHVSDRTVSSLALTSDETSVPAGIAAAPFSSIPASRLGSLTPDFSSAPAGSIPAGSIPAGSIPAGSIPAGSIPAGSIPAGSIPAGSIPAGSIGLGVSPAGSIPAGSIPAGSIALKSVLLSQIPLVGTTWADILKGSPFALQPLQGVTLDDIAHYTVRGTDGKTPWERFSALPLKNVPLFSTLWRNIPFSVLMLGNAPLDTLPTPRKLDGTPYASWSAAITDNGGSLTGVDTSTNTALGVAISGELGSTPAGSIPAGSIPAGSIPAGSIPAGSIDLGTTALKTVLVSDLIPQAPLTLASYVNCSGSVGGFTCPAGSTLGQASTAHALNPNLTLDQLFAALPAGSIGRQTTIDQLVQGMLPLADYPWEQISLQGLQDVVGTGKNVHYHLDFDLDCTRASRFDAKIALPDGFFPVAGSSKISYDGGAAQAVPDPTGSDPSTPVWSNLSGSCGADTVSRHVRLDFTSFAGLTLGTQASSVSVTPSNGEIGLGTITVGGQAPVLVTENWEPSDDPSTAPTIAKDTLIVGHISSSDDVDYFRFPLTGLAPGTRVAVYLKTARGTDLDLALNKPSAPTIQPNPAGSIPAGSIGIEDSFPGVDNSNGALPPDTLADVPAGSIPAGSIPAGSIPAGSISANRGAVNESVDIVTRGESGNAVIGVSGYNGAFSDDNYVLRVKVTPPPTLPACPAITGLGTATAGTLPSVASVPATTQTLFLVDRQRLAGMYSAARADAMLASTGPLAAVAARPEVKGVVLPIDGSASVRSAYAAWDANPCSVDAANSVVTAINGVVATYRANLPNLKYVVLLGDDQALPSWRQADLSSLSPEIDNAQELAFTTAGLTKGNSTYASSALNTVLTDGAYGAFQRVTFLGHDLPLAQVSVSRLVETPEEIAGQFTQYLAANGQLNVHSALTTGDDFFVDGAQDASSALATQFPGLSSATLFPPTDLWTRQNLLDDFFNKTGGVPDVGALYAHYNQWLAQPASFPSPPTVADFPTTGDVTSRAQLLFTIGCHSGLNVPDTVGGPIAPADLPRQLDWAQAYSRARTAVYVANTGFGYGDTKTVDLSERLMRGFARNLNTGGTIGEQWVRALHSYFSTAGLYDVVDEKVMVEANMYGLPFYGFSGTPQNVPTPPTPPATHVDNGLTTATLPAITAHVTAHDAGNGESLFFDGAQPDGTTAGGITSGTLSIIYRPIQPQLSRDVTVPGTVAHGAFITSLSTSTIEGVKPVQPFPVVFSGDEKPVNDYPDIFFPAGLVNVNRDVVFGKERDTAILNMGRFRPTAGSDTGTEQVVNSIGLDIGYSNASDGLAPQIDQVGAVKTGPGTFSAFVHATDDSGSLHRVAVLYNAGGAAWQVLSLTNTSDDLWTGTITTSPTVDSIQLDAEAQDNAGNVGFSFNKAVNFQSVAQDSGGPDITISNPLPGAVFELHQIVKTNFDCSDPGGIASCRGRSDRGIWFRFGSVLDTLIPGPHTFTVTATDLSGNVTTKTVPYVVVFDFSGFQPPVNGPPTLNVEQAGKTIPVKWTLRDFFGLKWPFLSNVQSISSKAIRCPSATTDPVDGEVPIGLSGLKITGGDFQFNWSTDKRWAGTCRRLFVHFSDGTTPFADFRFK
jgi:hypothetical protein